MKKALLYLTFILSSLGLFAQADFGQMINDPNANLFEIEQYVNDWIAQHPNEKVPKPVIRWIERMRVYADENGFIDRTKEIQAAQDALRLRQQSNSSRAGNWTHLGPDLPISFRPGGSTMEGIGRVNCINFHPTRPATIFAGTPGGGLFKSENYGMSWLPLTDNLPSLGVSDIEIHPTQPDIMYLATGDDDGQDTPCLGVLKSTDGGLNWTNVYPVSSNNFFINEMVMCPNTPDTLVLATSVSIIRTVDGGQNWTVVESGGFEDIEMHPTNPSIMYAVGAGGTNGYARSTDYGATWTRSAAGLPTGGGLGGSIGRMMVAVTKAKPDYVYVLATRDNQFFGLYQSLDAGQTFTARNTNAGSFAFAQSWYDLTLNASPLNGDMVFMGDVPFWRSNDGGANWTQLAGYGIQGGMHVDFHTIEFHPFTNDMWVGNDGGVFLAPNQNPGDITEIRSSGLNATQFYRLGTSVHEYGNLLAGAQDNGTMEMADSLWTSAGGGDGMECLISWEDPTFRVVSSQFGNFSRNISGNRSGWINGNVTGAQGAWTTPFIQDPNFPRTYYAGYSDIWVTRNQGSWSNLTESSGLFGSNLHKIHVPQAAQGFFMYAATRSRFYQTLDQGTSWRSFGFGQGGSFQDMATNYKNPRTIYGAFSNGVFVSNDAGETWSDMSTGLPAGLPVQAIVYQNGGPDALYVGTSVGVYYRDSSMSAWVPFMDGLPNVEVAELEISYCSGKIRAATYGRGVWESDLYNNGFQLFSNELVVDYSDGIDLTAQVSGGLAPFTYAWQNGRNTPTLDNINPGIYSVRITDKNHCVIRDTIVVTATSIENELDAISALQVYPNPFQDELNLQFEAIQQDEMTLIISNTVGQQLIRKRLQMKQGKNQFNLPMSNMPVGVYFVSMEIGGKVQQVKVVKQ